MAKHTSETPATRFLKQAKIAFVEHHYDYVARGGTGEATKQLGWPENQIIKTLVMQDGADKPLIILMHGDRNVSLKNLARNIGTKSVEPCTPAVAQRHTRCVVGGTSPFGLPKPIPIFVESSILDSPAILINGGKRGYLLELNPKEALAAVQATSVACALQT